eukprot:TRINITY_DN509_c0_g1_i3.p1 TRINITY_DN509_c0_g1~~TRINITY_DN509_c0_g1_i3.p1  ORF type:complete len:497 (+),score=57.95 TRINITY_DN509_c0_g1_i3:520-2010(+)
MPKMNGIELLQELNQRDMTDVPIIMVSSVEELQLVYQCLNLGASDFLTKPVRSETVTNLWQNVWRKRREQTALAMARQQARQIEKLEQEVEQAFTSPLEAITNQLLEVVGSSDVTDSAKDAMLAILKNVYEKTPGVYKPVLQDLVNNKRKIDSLTRSWLSRELYVADGAKPTSEADVVDLQPPTAEQTRQLRSWEFDVWTISDPTQLCSLIEVMFTDFNLLHTFRISHETFQNFVSEVKNNYHLNPYHNFRHAFDVTHMSYLILSKADGSKYLGSVEIFALLLSGLLHDVDHPGLNNNFQIETGSDLATVYNDKSVLENHHCSRGYKLVRATGLFENIPTPKTKQIRKLMVQFILGTDLSQHVTHLNAFDALLKGDAVSHENEVHRELVAGMILKCADLSNPAKPFPIAKYWAQMVQEEFYLQGDQEQKRGMPVSPFMGRGHSPLPQLQLGFIDHIVHPIFSLMVKLLPELEPNVLNVLLSNRQVWVQMQESELEV